MNGVRSPLPTGGSGNHLVKRGNLPEMGKTRPSTALGAPKKSSVNDRARSKDPRNIGKRL